MCVNELINAVLSEICQYSLIARRTFIWIFRIIETGQFPREPGRQRKSFRKEEVFHVKGNLFKVCQLVISQICRNQLCVSLL
jgi:hypothetical protein